MSKPTEEEIEQMLNNPIQIKLSYKPGEDDITGFLVESTPDTLPMYIILKLLITAFGSVAKTAGLTEDEAIEFFTDSYLTMPTEVEDTHIVH
jgi:hypothetical protein